MILVDTSVWIDFLRGSRSIHRRLLHSLLEEEQDICLTEIIVTEILQGISSDVEHKKVGNFLKEFQIFSLAGMPSFVHAARIYRQCRKTGYTIKSTIDCLIAVVALENRLALLAKDRDFELIARIEPLILVKV